ncbi:Cytochrome P450 71D10 [Hibiscus syriacus]|uniref:Cytochrome P450 71D10 n=1 Tax=Hibiscus syriacus TaxID=106335 RepID=A0A6A2X750_HIBSY|nr:Cytochrome P450 71D10 [Hibiscus syriacus]
MEFQFITIPFITLVFLFMVTRIVSKTKPKNSIVRNLPPGPWKLPLIGNMHQLVSALPHQTLRDLANKYGALMQLQLGQVPTIVVSSAEIAKEIMKTHDLIFSQRPYVLAAQIMAYNSTAIIFTPYGNYWRQMRKICMMELLGANRVQSFQSIREEELVKLAGGFCLSDMYPSSEFLKLISGMRIKLNKLHRASDKILENIVNEHKDKRNQTGGGGGCNDEQEDLVDVLLKIQQQGDLEFPLTNDNIKAVIQDVFGAGSETSATVVEWTMSELLKNPELLRKAQTEVRQVFADKKGAVVNESRIQELKFLKSVVKETLRLHPPGPLLVPRECSEDCMIKGYEVPAKTKVIINAWAIGRDPSYWEEAEKFDPERFMKSSIDFRGTNFAYIPFGAGRRICPGITYALPNIELPLANLLYHFNWELPNGLRGQDLDMTESFALAVKRKNDLYLIPTPYHV